MMNFLRKQMKWVMAIIVVAFLLSTFLMYEGRGTRRTPGRNADGSMTDYEVAKINGRSLMRSELERRLRDYLSNYNSRSAISLDMPALYQAVLDQAVLESQLAKEVEEKGIRVTDAEADRAMKDYADRYYPTRETFYQALANSGVKVEDYKRSLARRMATEQVISSAIGEIVISEDQAQEFYDTMKTLIYSRPEGYMLHMADFNTSGDAEFLRAKLEAGETWNDIVSKDELASHDVINITREPVFLPATAFATGALNVLASLDVGKVSPVFSVSSFDYAVGLKTEHVDASVRPYEEVSGDIKSLLTSQEERKRLTEFETALKAKAQLEINDTELFARPAVSEDTAPAVEDVIPELAETPAVSEEPKSETPAAVEETKPETETPAVVEEAKPETAEEAKTEEKPAAVEEAKTETETPAATEEETKTEAPAVDETKPAVSEEPVATETPAAVEETKTETETPAVVEEAKPETETPAVVEEAKPEATEETKTEETPAVTTPATVEETKPAEEAKTEETPSAVEEAKPETVEAAKTEDTPAVVEETQPETAEEVKTETPAAVEDVITKSEDMPLQEVITASQDK